jgi:hypothetical protein
VRVVPCPRGACTGPEIANVGASTLTVNVLVAVTLPEVPVMVKFLVPKGVELLEMSVRIVSSS